ncbi:TetR/AcrR family transcriptional regulator [Conyzicola nivalis]|uniref:TetR family transcriptional regulator n=1 Tax=Conyzicola nivalis TaxID=1477021 RepID=A0A916SNG9_9MICO|nr:TetR/AcrR family transcriptional regulator [Conyzicola nivalis]GGB05067.1 TetR family transcriptional regulator [Conyzicola nivalis]
MSEPRVNELLAIALEVLEDEGLEKLGVGTISRRAGIKPPSLYKQFTSKADIEKQLADVGFRLWATGLAAASVDLHSSASRRDRIASLAHAYRALGREHPQLFRLMNERPFLGAQLIRAVGESTSIDYGALFPTLTAGMSFWAWGHGILVLEIQGRFPPEVDLDLLWETMIDSVSAIGA